jgi:hypothetical protein
LNEALFAGTAAMGEGGLECARPDQSRDPALHIAFNRKTGLIGRYDRGQLAAAAGRKCRAAAQRIGNRLQSPLRIFVAPGTAKGVGGLDQASAGEPERQSQTGTVQNGHAETVGGSLQLVTAAIAA